MNTLPPVANPVSVRLPRPYLPPIKFRAKAYASFCERFDQALADLEARYPGRPAPLTIEARQKRLKKKRRPK
jgi:hypothetical protein